MGNDLFSRVDALLKSRGRVVIAIDGQSAAGKTRLAGLLAERYGARVLHADDFFLQPAQRKAARLAEPGGNLDRERFAVEVIAPVREGRIAYVRRFDCKLNKLLPPQQIPFSPVSIVEGSYCLHPALGPYYDLAIYLQVDPGIQRARLQSRYDAARLQRAMDEWVPMENSYARAFNIPEKCDFVLTMA
ncbi:MAG: uridine kinase [Candidatus Pelethousia sp.]|nr:uridine kinase [Candidatus Pelethousia sp.]